MPFKKTTTFIGIFSAILLILTEILLHTKSSEFAAGILPDWIVTKIGLVVLLIIAKLIVNKINLESKKLWLIFVGLSLITIVYLNTYQPINLF